MSVPEVQREAILKAKRRRVQLATTVHPLTIERLAALSARFTSNWGRIIDRLVETAAKSYEDGKVRCIHGGQCIAGRTDLPDTM